VVIPESKLEEIADTPGLIYREAFRKAKVVYEAVW